MDDFIANALIYMSVFVTLYVIGNLFNNNNIEEYHDNSD